MPWKETKDPYKIWVSEIILQQTRVAQGKDYYLRFINQFPDIDSLASAEQTEVLKQWEGLGYYSRARNLQQAAQDIIHRFNGVFPTKYDDIISLKGIGPYSAAAISSFAFEQPYAVVDGNVQRVLSRHFEILLAIDSTEGKKRIALLAQKLLDKKQPAQFNQAIMDFGALICTPKAPKCETCPLSKSCRALKNNIVKEIPFKSKKVKKTDRFYYFFLIHKEDHIVIQRRPNIGIWAGLHELPNIESHSALSHAEILSKINFEEKKSIKLIHSIQHKLTHLNLNITLYHLINSSQYKCHKNQRLEKVSELSTFAFPKPLKNFLDIFL